MCMGSRWQEKLLISKETAWQKVGAVTNSLKAYLSRFLLLMSAFVSSQNCACVFGPQRPNRFLGSWCWCRQSVMLLHSYNRFRQSVMLLHSYNSTVSLSWNDGLVSVVYFHGELLRLKTPLNNTACVPFSPTCAVSCSTHCPQNSQ